MFLSVFDIFKIGVGPSSSHTMGPMLAASRFLEKLRRGEDIVPGADSMASVSVKLHGSLAFTGKGHATDRAVMLGLAGFHPERFDADMAEDALKTLRSEKRITAAGLEPLFFDPERDIIFDFGPALPGHANALTFETFDRTGALHTQEVYYSVGGGFVLTERELSNTSGQSPPQNVPYPFGNAAEMLAMAQKSGLSIAQMKHANELCSRDETALQKDLLQIWNAMNASIQRGLQNRGILPGGLNLRRRACDIHNALQAEKGHNQAPPHTINDWISVYAIAVNEENAAGGQVVTAPTNGAAGVIPATIRYWLDHIPGASEGQIQIFLLTAAAIGGLIKSNASISGAEVGCQGEVGSASAMAAAGLCAVLGGTPSQVENAAEIAMEHHLGMTCDPVKGLVQAPCIERNGLGAIKAVSAASLALRGDGAHLVSLDACIETLRQTGRDMDHRYKETSLGGLAVNVTLC